MNKKVAVVALVVTASAVSITWWKKHEDAKFRNIHVYKPIMKESENRAPASVLGQPGEIHNKFSGKNNQIVAKSYKNIFSKSSPLSLGEKYKVSLTHRAAPLESFREDLGKPVGEFQRFVIYEAKVPYDETEGKQWEKDALPILQSENDGSLTLFSGMMIVQVAPGKTIDTIASGFGMEVTYSAPHLGVYYLKGTPGKDFSEQLSEIRNMEMVKDAQAELISSPIRAR
jgi:hypothetical protein